MGFEMPAKERIVDAAIDLFGERGFQGVSIKAVAELAEVSPSLVMHHFGSKAGLKSACDLEAGAEFKKMKTEAVEAGALPLTLMFDLARRSDHIVLYFFRSFVEGGDAADALFDQLVEDALDYTAAGEKRGLVYPATDPRARAVIFLVQGMGTLLLHRQIRRHLGVDPVFDPPEDLLPYISAVTEIYSRPTLNAEAYEALLTTAKDTGNE